MDLLSHNFKTEVALMHCRLYGIQAWLKMQRVEDYISGVIWDRETRSLEATSSEEDKSRRRNILQLWIVRQIQWRDEVIAIRTREINQGLYVEELD